MATNSFRTSLTFFTENVRISEGKSTISALPPMQRSWKYLTHLHYEWDVSLPSADTMFKLAITLGKHSAAKVAYTASPTKITFQVDNLVGTSVSETLVFEGKSIRPAYAVYLVRRSLNLNTQRHLSQVIAGIAEEMLEMEPLSPDERLDTLLDLLTEDYCLLVIDLRPNADPDHNIELTAPFDADSRTRLLANLKPFLAPLFLHYYLQEQAA